MQTATIVCFQKISVMPQGLSVETMRGILKAKIFKGKYEGKLEIPEGWGIQAKQPSSREVWIFSGTTHLKSTILGFWIFQ